MPRCRLLHILPIALLPLFATPVLGGVIAPELQAAIKSKTPPRAVPVIITLSDRVDLRSFRGFGKRENSRLIAALRQKANATQPPVLAMLKTYGATQIKQLWAVNSFAAMIPPGMLTALESNPSVESVRLDAVVESPATFTSVTGTPEWNISAVHAPDLWALGYSGAGIVLANMDSGVDADHPDLTGKWRGGSNSWFDPNGEHATPYDQLGHGTQTMGIMVGGDAGGTAIGIAPDAKWIAVKIFNDAGTTTLSRIHEGFQWLLDPDGDPATPDAPDVVNNSWGLAGPTDSCNLEFNNDTQLLKAAGIAVVYAAGNDGPATLTSSSPANNPQGYAVGSVDGTMIIDNFSSRGPSACDGTPYPELVAPGVDVRTADLSFGGMPNYAIVTGTSFSSPHVAGVMALLAQAHPTADVATLEDTLLQTAHDLGPAGPDSTYGYGMVDVLAAHEALTGQPSVPPPPSNNAPLASNDAYTALAGSVLSVVAPGVLGNDSDPDGDVLSTLLESPPTGGTLTLNADGSFSYTPNPGTTADSFSYRASDGSLVSEVANVSITVVQPNQSPTAVNDKAGTLLNTKKVIAVLANDYDTDGSLDPASVTIVSKPDQGGRVTVNLYGKVIYRPKLNFTGIETFTYKVRDNRGAVSNKARVTVRVRP